MKQVQDADLRQLRIFVTIVRCGSFTAAQSVLNIGQSAISEHMSRLETRLGTRLCERGRGGFRLTEAGEAAFAAAQRLLASVEHFVHETSGLSGELQGELKLGVIDNTVTNAESPLVAVIRRFHQYAERVRIHPEIRPPYELEQRVLDGRLDAAIGPFPVQTQGLNYQELFLEQHLLYCGQGHPFYDKKSIRTEDIQRSQVVAHGYEHGADLKKLRVKEAAAIVDSVEAQVMLILTWHYIGLLPRHYAAHWQASGELKALLPKRIGYSSRFFLATRAGGYRSPVVSAFLEEFAIC